MAGQNDGGIWKPGIDIGDCLSPITQIRIIGVAKIIARSWPDQAATKQEPVFGIIDNDVILGMAATGIKDLQPVQDRRCADITKWQVFFRRAHTVPRRIGIG